MLSNLDSINFVYRIGCRKIDLNQINNCQNCRVMGSKGMLSNLDSIRTEPD